MVLFGLFMKWVLLEQRNEDGDEGFGLHIAKQKKKRIIG